MPETFGDRLRKRRELRGIAIAAIAEDTKVSVSLFEALERDDLSKWPTGIFRRSFIRSYARAVGLDPDVTVRDFLEAHPDPASNPAAAELPSATDQERQEPTGGGIRSRLGSTFRALTGDWRSIESPGFGHLSTAAPIPGVPAPAATQSPEPTAAEPEPPPVSPRREIDLPMLAALCTSLATKRLIEDASTTLESLAEVFGAVGFIVWEAQPDLAQLVPVLSHGYPPSLLARMRGMPCDADNATAAAYRSGATCLVGGTDRTNGALTVPIIGPSGCAGVLAMELRPGSERDCHVQAAAAIVAAQLSATLTQAGMAVGDRKLA